MKNFRKNESPQDRRNHTTAARKAFTALALTSAIGAANGVAAQARDVSPLKQAMHKLEANIRDRKAADVNPNVDVLWATPGAQTRFTDKTSVAFDAKVKVGNKTETRFFAIAKHGKTLGSIVLEALPKDAVTVQSDLIDSPLVGEPWHTTSFTTKKAVVHMVGGVPEVSLRNSTGHTIETPVAQTTDFDRTAIPPV